MKKKGFTLIELLAVIVILAIIALIATPLVLKYIEKSRKESKVDSAYSFVRNLETEIANYSIKHNGKKYNKSGLVEIGDLTDIDTTVKGDTPSNGKVCLSSLGQVEKAMFEYGKYYVSYDGKKGSISDKDTYDNFSCSGNGDLTSLVGSTIYYDVDNGEKCDTYTEAQSAIGIKSGCMRFYVLNDNGDTLDLILDHNTTANIAWSDSETTINGPKNVLNQLYEDTRNWNGVLTPAGYKVNQTGKSSNANYSIDYSKYNGDTTLSYKARLVTVEELLNFMPYYVDLDSKDNWEESYMDFSYEVYSDSSNKVSQGNYSDELEEYKVIANEISSSSVGLPKFLHNGLCDSCSMGQYGYVECLTEGYWTATSLETGDICAWYVGNYGYLDYDYDINSVRGPGIRPVITIENN